MSYRDFDDQMSNVSDPASLPSTAVSDDGVVDDPLELSLLQNMSLNLRDSTDHELCTAPFFTRDVYELARPRASFPQRGLLGSVIEVFDKNGPCKNHECKDSRVYFNTNAPCSTLVCGVQGSGKSHTVSILLENMLIPKYPSIGVLEKPLSGLVLHFGEGGPYTQPCEAAWLGLSRIASVKPPRVRVFVSSSSLETMKAVYAPLGANITVEPLLFSEAELDAQAFLSMMAIGASDHVPLYMQTVLSILRELGEKYTYQEFINRLAAKKTKFVPAQLAGLEQRMALLESFLDKKTSRKSRAKPPRFAAGQLTIVDLSDPFIDPASACGFFEIITRLFVRAKVDTGKVLVVDEAHKYLSSEKTTTGLTKELLSLIRQQRHQSMRVIISTQEPTVVPPVLIGLCSITILHRFSSPAWWNHVAKHIAADVDHNEAFDKVVNLQTGQAIVLAPAGMGVSTIPSTKTPEREYKASKSLQQFGRKCVLIKTRQRVSTDGGASLLVVDV